MNREIKFRAFNKHFSEPLMFYQKGRFGNMEANKPVPEAGGYKPQGHLETFIRNGDPVMQFTGLHDKNGVEIYEGDIFKYEKHPGYLMDTFVSWVKWLNESAGFGYQVWPDQIQGVFFDHFSSHDELEKDFLNYVEVIGNIYETPDLLPLQETNGKG